MYECERPRCEAAAGDGGKQHMLTLAYTACMRHKCVFDKSGWMVALASVTICRVKGDV